MSDETVRIGVVGAGKNTTLMHIPGFQAIDGVEVVSVTNRTRESGQRVADQFNIPTVYERWDDLIAAADSNAICVGTWPYMHRTLVLAALGQDKHVLTEARLAMNAAEARQMLDASRGKPHLVTQVVPADFTFDADRMIIELIEDGYVGEVLAADLVFHGGFIDRDSPHMWRNDRDLSGYNVMLLGAFFECLMRWLGPAVSVTALTRVNVRSRKDASGVGRPISIPDHVEGICELASGAVLHVRFSEVVGLAPPHEAWIFGTEGTLKLEIVMGPKQGEVSKLYGGRRGDEELAEIDIPPEKKGRWQVEEEFINAIRGNEPVTLTTFEDGVRYMEFTEAVTRSAQSGRTVYLPL